MSLANCTRHLSANCEEQLKALPREWHFAGATRSFRAMFTISQLVNQLNNACYFETCVIGIKDNIFLFFSLSCIQDSFEHFINKRQNKPAELIGKFFLFTLLLFVQQNLKKLNSFWSSCENFEFCIIWIYRRNISARIIHLVETFIYDEFLMEFVLCRISL